MLPESGAVDPQVDARREADGLGGAVEDVVADRLGQAMKSTA
jgi:hypothetical protein